MTDLAIPTLKDSQRYTVAIIAFLGWMFAGFQLAIVSIVMRDAAKHFLGDASEGDIGQWFGWLTAAFMFGAAAGGYLLGWFGDRFGRKPAIALSIACYSLFSGFTYFASNIDQLLLMRFLVGIGVGGMWPNGIALVTEAWPNLSRPLLAGVIGTAANVGLLVFSGLACVVYVTADSWRWALLVGSVPILLALVSLFALSESPLWLAARQSNNDGTKKAEPGHGNSPLEVFRPPILRITIIGILLGTIPLFGGWGSSHWANAWASQVGEKPANNDPALKARTLMARYVPSTVTSLLGGLLAMRLGRRLSFFIIALGCLVSSLCLFRCSHPSSIEFFWWTAALGFFNGFFFGWLPYCLPEMFPTQVRATGAGVSFNFGRIATAIGIVVVASMLKKIFDGDYSKIGQFTSWIYLLGAIAIWLAPSSDSKAMAASTGSR